MVSDNHLHIPLCFDMLFYIYQSACMLIDILHCLVCMLFDMLHCLSPPLSDPYTILTVTLITTLELLHAHWLGRREKEKKVDRSKIVVNERKMKTNSTD